MSETAINHQAQIESLSRQLGELDAKLQALISGDVDAVIGPDGQSFLLRQAQTRLLQSEDELRALTQKLQQERAKLVAAQAVAKIGSWSIDQGLRKVEWSDEMYRLIEVNADHFPLHVDRIKEFVHPHDRDEVLMRFQRSFAEDTHQVLEHRLLTAGGTVKFVEQRWQIERDASGKAVRAFGTCQDTTERRCVLDAFRRSEANLRMAVRLSRIGTWSVALATRSVWWSDEVCAMHDLEPGTSPSLDEALQYFLPEWRPLIEESVLNCTEKGTPYDIELEIMSARGRRIWVRCIGEAIRDAGGVVERVQGVVHDLSDRKRAENEVRRLAKRLTGTLEGLNVGFFSVDHDWRITYFNVESERIFGRHRDDVLGQVIWHALPQLMGTEFENSLRQADVNDVSVIREARLPSSDLWFRATVHPSEEGLAVFMRDVTVEHAASLRLKLLEASVDKLHDIILITDAEPLGEPGPRIRFANEALTRGTGYSPAEVIGRSPRFLQGPDTDRRELARIKGALSRFEPVHTELLNYKKSGETYWIEIDIVPVAAGDQGGAHFVAVQRDITERKRGETLLRQLNVDLENRVRTRTAELSAAREEAESANRAKSTFLAAVSHEIRTPMNGIIGLIDVLAHSSLLPSQVEMVGLVRDSAESLLSIIDDILDFSKIEAGKLQIERVPINPHDIAEKVGVLLAPVARRRNVALTVFIDPEIPTTVLGDELRLRQILINLLGNAIKFSSGLDRSGRVRLRLKCVERESQKVSVELTVSDNGVGIDAKTRDSLFQPFSQADASTTRRFGGTGLGLAITKMLVDIHGGHIDVESAPGEGATFRVTLPLESAPSIGSPASAEPSLRGVHCRIIGADVQVAADLSIYLARAGAWVERLHEVPNVAPQVRQSDASIWLILPDVAEPDRRVLRALAAQSGSARRMLMFRFGDAETASTLDGGPEVSVPLDALTRDTLLRSVAAAAGMSLPMPPVSKVLHDTDKVAPLAVAGSRIKQVLVVDDIETNREVIQRQLKLLGLDAEIAVNGEEALELWRSGNFHLVLTDVRMPLMDGYALARAIRNEETVRRHTIIIALTADALPEEESKCLAAGMDGYLVKPVTSSRLRAILEDRLCAQEEFFAENAITKDSVRSPVNLEVLKSLIGDDPAGIASVLGKFRVNCSQLSAELEHAIESNMFAAAADIVHKLKAGAVSIGARRLSELCVDIEHAAVGSRREQLDDLLPRFRAQVRAVDSFIDASMSSRCVPLCDSTHTSRQVGTVS